MDLLNLKYNNINLNNNNILIVFSHIIDVNIEKLWIFLRDLLPSSDKSSKNFMFIKGNNTWKAGNKFTYYWSHIYKVKSETIDIVDETERKKINSEELINKESNSSISTLFSLKDSINK